MIKRERDAEAELNLPPGFRFHPTDEELVVHYLCRKAAHQFLPVPIIADVDLYKFDPWHLPEKALFGQREWYFFTPRDRKYPNGSRPNRAAGSGYWKATGADKPITPAGSVKPVAIKKALVFYAGKAPRGVKTNWIMHEYRLADTIRTPPPANGNGGNNRKGVSLRLDEWVLCRLYNKKNNWEKELQQQRQPQQNPAEDPSFRDDETTEPYEAAEDVASHSQGTPESDVDNDYVFPEPVEEEDDVDPDGDEMDAEGSAEEQVYARIKEEGGTSNHPHVHHHNNGRGSAVSYNDWFLDLNLEDLQNSLDAFGSGGVPGLDLPPYPEQLFSANAVPAPKNGGVPPPF